MTPLNLPPADQPDHFAEVAAALYRIADSIVTLTGSDLPKARFTLSIQPGKFKGGDDLNAGAVDAVTSALFGHPGQVDPMSDGTYLYTNRETGVERVGPVDVRVLTGVSTEWVQKREAATKLAEREAELERLRAEVAALRAAGASTKAAYPVARCGQLSAHGPHVVDHGPDRPRNCPGTGVMIAADPADIGLGYSREADDPTPVSPARVPLHTGAVVDGNELIVDEPAPPAGVLHVADGHVVHECCGKLDGAPHKNFCAAYVPPGPGAAPAPTVEHYEKHVVIGEGKGDCGVKCACGFGYLGRDSVREASDLLAVHIAASVAPSDTEPESAS